MRQAFLLTCHMSGILGDQVGLLMMASESLLIKEFISLN